MKERDDEHQMKAIAQESLARKARADRMLEQIASELSILLKEACGALHPFPSFPNAFFTNAIECDPGSAGDPERGCVVVGEDGELYELEFGVDHDAVELTGSWDPVTARKEEKHKLDLHPRDYVVYAYSGLLAVTEALLEQDVEEEAES
tara:strand:- start:2895 stop:3341 length:447 start_codon:yes stop_codon:yes gene_type:complete